MREFSILEKLHYIPQAMIVFVLLIMSFLFIQENRGHIKEQITKLGKQRWLIIFLFYTALILTGTILARPCANPYTNITGFIWLFTEGELNIGGLINILMFVPYTFLYLNAFKTQKPIVSCIFVSIGSTMFIELFQLLFWVGWFSLADMIHNIIGGMIGCILWHAQKKYINRLSRNSKS